MAITQVDAVLAALVAQLQAATGLRAPTDPAGDGIPVYDGPAPTLDSTPVQQFVAIGWDGDTETSSVGASTQQDWHDFGGTPGPARDETGQISCCILAAPDGIDDTDLPALRAAAVATLGLVETAIRADVSLGLANLLWCHITANQLIQEQNIDGALVNLQFVVTYRALI